MKSIIAFCLAFPLTAQISTTPANTATTISSVNANIQILSPTAIKAKYLITLPKGISAASAVLENTTGKVIYVAQGSVLIALRSHGYAVLSSTDAQAVVMRAERHGFTGFVSQHLPFASKLLNDTNVLIVSKALKVSPGVGVVLGALSAVAATAAPDVAAQIAQLQQTYATDGLQSLVELSPGQSAVATVILDSPASVASVKPNTFAVPVVEVPSAQTPSNLISSGTP